MNNTLSALLFTVTFLAGCGNAPEYVFRNDVRPAYDKTVSVNELQEMQDASNLVLLDVRLLEDYQKNATLIPGASYQNPDQIQTWASALPEDSKVVVYCKAGRWVSQKAATYLSAQGIDTYSLEGGIEAWQAVE